MKKRIIALLTFMCVIFTSVIGVMPSRVYANDKEYYNPGDNFTRTQYFLGNKLKITNPVLYMTNEGGTQCFFVADVENISAVSTGFETFDIVFYDENYNEIERLGGIISPVNQDQHTQINVSWTLGENIQNIRYYQLISDETGETSSTNYVWDGSKKTEVVPVNDTYTIDSPDELAWFAQAVNTGNSFVGKHIYITGEMDLGNNIWEPIGNGKILECFIEIKDCHITRMTTNVLNNGLFGNVSIKKFIIDNLCIDDSTISKNSWDTHNLGLLAGALTIPLNGYLEVRNSEFRGTLSNTHNFDYGFTGGIIGKLTFEAENGHAVFDNNVVEGNISGSNAVGGMFGFVVDADLLGTLEVNKCYIDCTINASNSYGYEDVWAGGITGILNGDNVSISQCTIKGSIYSSAYEGYCGGLAGHCIYNSLKISDCAVQASINSIFSGWYGSKYNGAGFLGLSHCKDSVNSYIKNSYFSGLINSGVAFVTRDDNAGDSSIPIINCYFDMDKTGLAADMMHSYGKYAGLMTNVLSGCAGYTTEQMQEEVNFVNWDFDNIWIIDNEEPRIRNEQDRINEELQKSFNEYIYRANYLLNDLYPGAMCHSTMFKDNTPCELLHIAAMESGLDKTVAKWEAINGIFEVVENPMNVIDWCVEPKDMYSAILMNILESSIDFSLVDNQLEADMKLCKDFTTSIRNIMLESYKVDIYNEYDFRNLTTNEKENLSKYAEKWFKENDIVFVGNTISEFFKGVTNAFDTINSIEDFYCRIVSAMALQNISEEMKDVLRKNYENSKLIDNLYLQQALKECVQIIDESTEKMIKSIILEEITMVGVDTVKWLFEEILWKDIVNSYYIQYPSAAFLMAVYKGVSLGVNELFSTDEISEQYLRMLAIEDIETLFDYTYYDLGKEFLKESSTNSAKRYFSALDLVFQSRIEDCRQAYEFVDIIDESTYNKLLKLFGITDNNTNAKEFIRSYKGWCQNQYALSFTQWLIQLEMDYPESNLYEFYSEKYNKKAEQLLKKQITIACPVDIYVYDSVGKLVATSINGIIGCKSDNIGVIQVGDEKTLLFYDDQEYTIRCVGTDSGSMDISVFELGSEENIIRSINYYDINLTEGIEYQMSVPKENLLKNQYNLRDVSSDIIVEENYDSLKDNVQHRVVIKNGAMEYNGGLYGDISAKEGITAQLQAYVPKGYSFIKWISSCKENIFENEYSTATTFIMPDEDCEIIALIEKDKKDITISALDQTILWGNGIDQSKYQVLGDGLAEGDRVDSLILTPSTTEITSSGIIEMDSITIVNKEGLDVTDNYNIAYAPANLVIEHNINLSPIKIEVLKSTVEYMIGEVLNIDDIIVTAYYEDGYIEDITDYVTNVEDIDMTTVGEKKLTVSYTNNATVTKDIFIIVGSGYAVNLPSEQIGYRITADVEEALWNGNVTFTFKLADGYTKTDAFVIKVNGNSVILGEDGTYTMTNVLEEINITVEGVADITAPVIEIKVKENGWTKFFNTITFGIFFKETQDVIVSVSDVNTGSGIDKAYYYISNEAMSEDEVKALTSWTEYDEKFSITPNNTYVIYVKVMDEAGNVTYASTDGIVVDETAPVIAGIEDKGVYYEEVTFSVTDEYIDKVYVDDEEVTLIDGTYTIYADDKEHTINVTDKAGNITSYTITVKYGVITHASLGYEGTYDGRGHSITVTVTEPSDVKISYSTDEGDTKNYSEENPEFVNVGSYTVYYRIEKNNCITEEGEQTIKISKRVVVITAADQTITYGESIDKTKYSVIGLAEGDSINAITFTPSTENVSDNGTIAMSVDKIMDAIGDDVTTNYDITYTVGNLIIMEKPIIEYEILDGQNSVWEGNEIGIAIKGSGDLSKFMDVKVDGVVIDKGYYIVEAGSTIVNLSTSYLENLSTGIHTVELVWTDGFATTVFYVLNMNLPIVPETDDQTGILFWFILLSYGLTAFFLSYKLKHKN